AELRDETLPFEQRADALKFLVHFVVDLHQPLHVGLAEDRGGNSISLRFEGESTNLHRFWDTHAIEALGLETRELAEQIRRAARNIEMPATIDPRVWAAESLALRPQVYDFDRGSEVLPPEYVAAAAATTRERLTLAAVRLAATLNDIYCD
ncbi:MAG: S1/P1 nuclease, partial [Gammaproteobacteria bacterium]|nr:S1/P1 nuclease [Gammaproteobacteria bacterium]